jgi:UDP-N-acetylglucosamine transferase subunit ALG13
VIFVIMGMEVHPFDRLARAIDDLQASAGGAEDYFVQLGACTYQPRHARFQRFLSFGQICQAIRQATVVITHAGAGSTLVCIQQGKHPIMVPRRARWGEHVDEHQVPFAEKLSQAGLATACDDLTGLAGAIAAARGRAGAAAALPAARELTGWLQGFWEELGRRADGRR